MTIKNLTLASLSLASLLLMGQARQSTVILTRGGVTTTVPIPGQTAPSQSPAARGHAPAADDFQGKKWIPLTGMDKQIFPSTILTMATSKKQFNILGIKLRDVKAGMRVRTQVSCDSLLEPIDQETTIPRDAPVMNLPLNIKWKFDALSRIHQQTPMTFSYRVSIDGTDTGEKVDTVTVHPVNVCMFAYRTGAEEITPVLQLFVGYVNENSPNLDKLLKDALATGVVQQFDGYRSGDPKKVTLQVLAIWHILQKRGVKYSNVTDKPKDSSIVFSQYVRFPSESIENAQANCVDGTVALASALQKIGIDTALIGTPDHMYLAFYQQPRKQNMQALETTLLGDADVNQVNRVRMDMTDGIWQNHPSGATFLAALRTGAGQYKELTDAAKKTKSTGEHEFVGSLIPIDEARRTGYMPIPQNDK